MGVSKIVGECAQERWTVPPGIDSALRVVVSDRKCKKDHCPQTETFCRWLDHIVDDQLLPIVFFAVAGRIYNC
jgi:hypothetical protein